MENPKCPEEVALNYLFAQSGPKCQTGLAKMAQNDLEWIGNVGCSKNVKKKSKQMSLEKQSKKKSEKKCN